MIRILLFISLLFQAVTSFTQSLTVSELFSICNKPNWDDVNESLTRKGWEYDKSSKGDDDHYSTITWAYNKSLYDDKAQGWFHLYTYDGSPGKISFNFFSPTIYASIKSGLISQSAKFLENAIEENSILTKYTTNNFLITLTTSKSEGVSYGNERMITSYTIEIIKRLSTYDEDNGVKKMFDDEGNLEAEIILKNGELNGISKTYYSDGTLKMISTFVNGKKQGLVKQYNEEGRIDSEYEVLNDGLNGNCTNYYYNDNILFLKEVGKFLNGKRIGMWQLLRVKDSKTTQLEYHIYNNNGEYNGAFKEAREDSIIFGSYRNGLLHGNYKVHISLTRLFFGGEITGDTTNTPIISQGSYFNGKKDGFWKNYSLTKALSSEGAYSEDEKSGEWKYYHDVYSKKNSNETQPYSKELYLIENYRNGKLNGKSVRFSYLQRKEIDCDTTGNPNANPLDTCHTMVYEKLKETVYYKDDILHGPLEVYDSIGLLKMKGTFVNGERDGFWIEGYKNDGFFNLENLYMYQKGIYSNGKRIGMWEEYFTEREIKARMNYKDGVLDGLVTELDSTGKASTIYLLENDSLKSINVYDSTKLKIIRTYIVLYESNNEFNFRKTENTVKGKVVTDYIINKYSYDPFSYRNFELNLIFLVGNLSDGKTGYKQGEYKEYNKQGGISIEGTYVNNLKVGIWSYYSENGKLIKTENYLNGILQ